MVCILFSFDVKIESESPQSILKRFIKPYDIENLGLVKLIELLDRDIRNLRLSICILKAKKKSIFPEKITFTIFVLCKPVYTYLFLLSYINHMKSLVKPEWKTVTWHKEKTLFPDMNEAII